MSLKAILAPACVAAALALAGASPSLADDDGPRVRKVNCDNGGSIQTKIDKAKEGDTIEVTGTCLEDVVITKDRITLDCVSPANASIVGTGATTTTLQVTGSNVTVANCTVSGGSNVLGAITIRSGGSARVENNKIAGGTGANATNVAVAGNSYGQLVGNEISGGVNGVFILSSSMADLFQNSIGGVVTGIGVFNSSSADIVDNTVTGRGLGIGNGVFVSRTSTGNFSNDVIFGNTPNVIQNFGTGIRCSFWSVVRFGPAPPFVVQNPGTGNGLNADTSTGCFSLGTAFPPPV